MSTKMTFNVSRTGLTIIEVLTSIVVAMIGVMGVMILVPFAVRQAQTGMDTEAAAVVARNAYSQFEIGGYRNHGNWLVLDPGSGNIVRASTLPPQPYSIDPLGVTEHPAGPNYTSATSFPFNDTGCPYRIPVANLSLPDTNPLAMNKVDARRLFQAYDDLVFGDSQNSVGQQDAQLNGPNQLFDFVGTTPVRRQAAGRFSWSVIAVPNRLASAPVTSVSNWKLYVLVYKDRDPDATAQDTTPINFAVSPKMRVAQVTEPTTNASPVNTVRIDLAIQGGAIKKDDWVMLVNQRDTGGNPISGYDWQIAFYRVVNYQSGTNPYLSLDGPDFDFSSNYSQTYIVHLKNVVGVFERTIVPEGNSTWNIAF